MQKETRSLQETKRAPGTLCAPLPIKLCPSDSGVAAMTPTKDAVSATNTILILKTPLGGTIDPEGALQTSIPVSSTGGLVLTTNPLATATGGVQWSPAAPPTKAAPSYVAPGNPTGTVNTAPTFMGLGSATTITPLGSAKVVVAFDFAGANSSTNQNFLASIWYGTGTPPTNGTLASSVVGAVQLTPGRGQTNIPAATSVPISFNAVAGVSPPLTVGTPYWFDVALSSPTGVGTASITQVSTSLFEL